MTPPAAPSAAYWFSSLFDGGEFLRDCLLECRAGRVHRLVAGIPRGDLSPDVAAFCAMAIPGMIDLQVNGAGDVMFGRQTTVRGLRRMTAGVLSCGVCHYLPTLMTDTPGRMQAACRAIDSFSDPSVLGLHLEGPFINPGKAGVHNPAHIRPFPGPDAVTGPERGVTAITLAPEIVGEAGIRALAGAGIRVFLGHSLADAGTTGLAARAGARAVTHLFNAMPPMLARAPGMAGAALCSDSLFAGLILDGVHVHDTMATLAMNSARGRIFLVSDAMAPVGGKREGFSLGGRRIRPGPDGAPVTASGRLAGACRPLNQALGHAIRRLGRDRKEAIHMVTLTPARVLGLAHELGRLTPGYRASLSVLEPDSLAVLAVIVDGTLRFRCGEEGRPARPGNPGPAGPAPAPETPAGSPLRKGPATLGDS